LKFEIKCDYCEENDAMINLHNFFIFFSEDNKNMGYNICQSCFDKLEEKEILKSIEGFSVMLIRIVGRENIRYKNGYVHIVCENCGNEYSVLTNTGHILPFNALEEEKQKWTYYLKCDRCGYENFRYD
jgi:protein-arginine kinase activator protein McsA